MISAFDRSTPLASACLVPTKRERSLPASSGTESGVTLPLAVPANGAVAPGCTVATTRFAVAATVASSLPLKTRRWNTGLPPLMAIEKQSLTKPASSAAAMRGATSQPLGVFESSTMSALLASTAARIARAAFSTQ